MPKNPARSTDWVEDKYYRRSKSCRRKKTKLATWLRKRARKQPKLLAEADGLEDCKPERRCLSPICPECSDAHRRLLTAALYRFLSKPTRQGNIAVISIVPSDGILASGPISIDLFRRLVRRWKSRLNRAGIDWFCGGIDISFNEHAKSQFAPHWCVHIFGFCATDDLSALKLALKKAFKATELIRRPVKAVKWDGKRRAIRYAFKNEYWRRITLDGAQKRNRRTTDKQPLRTAEKINLIAFLSSRPSRLFLCRAQFVVQKSRLRVKIRDARDCHRGN